MHVDKPPIGMNTYQTIFALFSQLLTHHAKLCSLNQTFVTVHAQSRHPEKLRIVHGYGFTHGASKTGTAGTGTVLDFSTPQHTVYPYRGVAGISWVNPAA